MKAFWGETLWKSGLELSATKRVYFYSETDLDETGKKSLNEFAEGKGKDLQFRSIRYRDTRNSRELPYGFISHDSRDKDIVARPIAITLQSLMSPVWHDEFSLKVGYNLRLSIEKGIRNAKNAS